METSVRTNTKGMKKTANSPDEPCIKRHICTCCKTECEPAPDYLKINGYWYEKMDFETVGVPLDLEEATIESLKSYASNNNFISSKEALRHLLREFIELDSQDQRLVKRVAAKAKKTKATQVSKNRLLKTK